MPDMIRDQQRREHEEWLRDLTSIPTAAGCEARVTQWIRNWVKNRRRLRIREDRAGNLIVTRSRPAAAKRKGRSRPPLIITAHLDHPAFVVVGVANDDTIELEFRGGVSDPYFENAAIEIFDSDDRSHRAV